MNYHYTVNLLLLHLNLNQLLSSAQQHLRIDHIGQCYSLIRLPHGGEPHSSRGANPRGGYVELPVTEDLYLQPHSHLL